MSTPPMSPEQRASSAETKARLLRDMQDVQVWLDRAHSGAGTLGLRREHHPADPREYALALLLGASCQTARRRATSPVYEALAALGYRANLRPANRGTARLEAPSTRDWSNHARLAAYERVREALQGLRESGGAGGSG